MERKGESKTHGYGEGRNACGYHGDAYVPRQAGCGVEVALQLGRVVSEHWSAGGVEGSTLSPRILGVPAFDGEEREDEVRCGMPRGCTAGSRFLFES